MPPPAALADAAVWPRPLATARVMALGIEVHEDPRIIQRRPDVDATNEAIEPGMVFTIEPGAYFPGLGRRSDRGRRRCHGGRRRAADTDVTTEIQELLTALMDFDQLNRFSISSASTSCPNSRSSTTGFG